MTDPRSSGRISILNQKKPRQESNRSLSPSSGTNPISNAGRRSSARSTGARSIQMEPQLQSLLIAEGQAAEMIAAARLKRLALMKQTHQEVQAEIEAFRQEHERRYQIKLREATQIEQFQAKLDADRQRLLQEMEREFRKQRKSLVHYIVHHVIDQIPVGPRPNTKYINAH